MADLILIEICHGKFLPLRFAKRNISCRRYIVSAKRIYRACEASISRAVRRRRNSRTLFYRTLYPYAHIKLKAVGDGAPDVPSSTKVVI